MSEISETSGIVKAAGETVKELARAVEKTVQEIGKMASNASAGSEGEQIEADARTQQRELTADAVPETHDLSTDRTLPLEAQPDTAWPFGQPDNSTAGPFNGTADWLEHRTAT